MTNKELEELKNAFDIPEPQHKNEFAEVYLEQLKKNKPSLFPQIFRFCSAAALCVLALGIFSHFRDTDYLHDHHSEIIITDTVTSVADTIPADTALPVTSSLKTDNTTPSAASSAHSTVYSASTVSAVSSSSVKNSTANFTTAAVRSSVSAASPASSDASAVYTTANVSTKTALVTSSVSVSASSRMTTSKITAVSSSTAASSSVQTTADNNVQPVVTIPSSSSVPTEKTVSIAVTPSIVYSADDICGADVIDNPSRDKATQIQGNDFNNGDPLSDMAQQADVILIGRLSDIIYTSISGNPFTQENILAENVLLSDGIIKNNVLFSLYLPGGYIKAEDLITSDDLDLPPDSLIYQSGGISGNQKLDSSYLFMLKKSDDIPENAYAPVMNSDISIFALNGSNYVSVADPMIFFSDVSIILPDQ